MNININSLVIKKEYEELVPRVTLDEYQTMKHSIEIHGIREPIVVNMQNVVIDGHTRIQIAKELQLKEIPYRTESYKDQFEEEEAVIAYNLERRQLNPMQLGVLGNKIELILKERAKLNNHTRTKEILEEKAKSEITLKNESVEAFMNSEKPQIMIKNQTESTKKIPIDSVQIAAKKVGISKDTQFKVDKIIESAKKNPEIKKEMDKALKGDSSVNKTFKMVKQIEDKENRMKAIKEAVAPNETFVQILEGDFFEKIKEIKDKSIDLLFIDPPYGILKTDWDDKTLDELREFTEKWILLVMPKLKSIGRCYICFSTWYEYELQKILEKHNYFGLISRQKLIWYYKNNNKPSNRKEYRYSYEPIFYLYGKDATELNFPAETYGETQTNVWEIATPQSNFKEGKFHESQKPEELLKRIILTGSKPNDLILDPFAGSGTTGVLCEQLKRKCILIEQSSEYCKIARGRINIGVVGKRL